MIAAAPEGSPPRRISNKQFKKTLPAVPRRGPEAGFHRIHYDFHGFWCEHSVHAGFSRAESSTGVLVTRTAKVRRKTSSESGRGKTGAGNKETRHAGLCRNSDVLPDAGQAKKRIRGSV